MKPVSQLLYDGYQLQLRNKYEEAALIYRKILRVEPRNADVMVLLGIVCDKQTKHAEAVDLFDKAIKLNPDMPQAHHNRGVTLAKLYRHADAATSFLRGYELRPELPEALSEYASMKRRLCDWRDYDRQERELTELVRSARAVVNPFIFMQFSDDPADQFKCARNYVAHRRYDEPDPQRVRTGHAKTRGRIHLGYLSTDFGLHPIGQLIAGLIEAHDRTRFEVTAISIGVNDGSPLRARLEAAFDRFIDASDLPTETIVARIEELKIDILIDLNGHTDNSRLDVLAARPAPVQVNYLGFPGTLGADFVDYVLADPFIVTPAQQQFFSEQLVHLPDSYQANDPKRTIGKRTLSRSECRLPESGIVFCCFNHNLKITPRIFDLWMRVLARTPGSVLWVLKDREEVEKNLRREAVARGVDPARLVFAPRVSPPEHLARHRLADLFLDTLPYNAHTTASDALWSGLPLVTCPGRTFPARVAGSLLHAIGLPDLVTKNLDEYEMLALSLATEPARLLEVRERLVRNRLQKPLFDFERYRRHIEAAYETMVETWRRGEPPRAFAVERLP